VTATHVVCQLEIDHLLMELAEKDDALIAALQDRDAYQLLSRVALARIAELTTQNDRLRASVRRRLEAAYGAILDSASDERQAA
jgi:hypothetical protein